MAEPYLFPVSILKDIEPWLTEYFAYQRFHIQPEIEQAFEAKYHRVEDFLKVNNEHINHIPHIHLAECDNQFLDKLEAIINKYSPFENEEKIYCCLWIASVLYRKYDNFGKDHSNFDIDYLEQRDMFDQYSKHIRPEMLKLLTFLKGHITTTNKQTGFQTPLPIRIEAGAERIEIDNTAGWFVGALEEYLHTFLGVENKEEVNAYILETSKKSSMDRTELNKGKTGVEIKGIKAINPINGKEVPIFLGDFVLGDYGTGAVMAVPSHDQRDFEYAKEHNLEMVEVISGGDTSVKAFEKHDYLGKGCKLVNSEEFTGMTVEEAKEAITNKLEKEGIARRVNNYKMRDWIFSRQRFWGEPIPMIYCDKCGWEPMDEKDLPLLLPDIAEYEPTDTGESPLAKIDSFVNTTCPKCGGPAKRETDTMPNWAGSSWYFLRYMDPHNDKEFASMDAMKYWNRVDWYNGGMEHTARHLLYARFWVQMLYNFGLVPKKEMIWTRVSHGMVLGDNNEKMSKSKGNVINPDDIVNDYGADTLRVYEMFMGDYEQDAPWSTDSLKGCKRFIDRVIRLKDKVTTEEEYSKDLEVIINKSIKKVGYDLTHMAYNTAVSTLMILVNAYDEKETITKGDYRVLLDLLNPIAPHITEELNESLGYTPICDRAWPTYDEEKTIDNEIDIAVQVNGKVRDTIRIKKDSSKEELEELAMNSEVIKKWLEGKEIVKVICVPNRIVNIVIR